MNTQGAEQVTSVVDGSLYGSLNGVKAGGLNAPNGFESPALSNRSPQVSPCGPPGATQPVCDQIVFIDSAIYPDFQLTNADFLGVTVIVLDAGRDAIRQITDVLSTYRNLSAIHIVSHGGPRPGEPGHGQADSLYPGRLCRRPRRLGPVSDPRR